VVSHGSEHALGQCKHEEADTRIVVHVRHALERGAESVLVRTVDTDVVVILLEIHDLLAYNQLSKVWVAFAWGATFRLLTSTESVLPLESLSREPYQSSTLSLSVTVLRHSVVSEKRQRGEYGN